MVPTTDRNHIGAGTGIGVRSDPLPTPKFPLLKLHGSISWWYDGYDVGVVEDRFQAGSTWASPQGPASYAALGADIANRFRERLIVPPATNKSRLSRLRLIRDTWRMARAYIARADRIFVIGYSFPPTDLQAHHLLRAGLSDRQRMGPISIEIVDLLDVPNDSSCADRFQALEDATGHGGVHQTHFGPGAVEQFTSAYLKVA